MAKLKDIRGTNVQSIDGDPSNPIEGQIWYNASATSKVLKAQRLTAAAAWATIPALNTSRNNQATGGSGDSTAGLSHGGWPATYQADVEEFDGTTWTAATDLSTGSGSAAGFGTQTAAVHTMGGNPGRISTTEEYDGSSWTAGGNSTYSADVLCGAGILTAGLVAGGNSGSAYVSTAAEYNGTSWTSANSLPQTLNFHSGCGTQTASIMGASQVTTPNTFFEYDGTNWSSAASLGSANYNRAMAGVQTDAIYIGKGSPANQTAAYDGTAWSDLPATTPFVFSTGTGTGNTAGGANALIASAGNAAEYQPAGQSQTVTIDVD